MATQVTFVGDGTSVIYAIPFDYAADGSDLFATVDGNDAAYTFDNPSTLRLGAPAAAGSLIRIFRKTPFSAPEVVFADSSILSADDLNSSNRQLFRRVQEVGDDVYDVQGRSVLLPVGSEARVFPPMEDLEGRLLGVVSGEFAPIQNDPAFAESAAVRAEEARAVSVQARDTSTEAAAVATAAKVDAVNAGDQIRKATWAELAQITSEPVGRIGVSLATSGTHGSLAGDVGASNGQTPDGGQFRFTPGTGWVRLGDLDSAVAKAWAKAAEAEVVAISGTVTSKPLFHRLGSTRRRVLFSFSAPGGKDFGLWDETGDFYMPDLKLSFSQLSLIDARTKSLLDASGRPANASAAIALADLRPVDVIFCGDSHQRMNGYGLFGARSRALIGRYGMYATQFSLATAGAYSPAGNGGGFSGVGIAASGAPSELEAIRFPDVGGAGSPSVQTKTYGYLPDGVTSAATSIETAMSLQNITGVDVTASWRCDYHLGTFPSSYAGGGTMTLAARLDAVPYSTLAQSVFASKKGAFGRVVASLTIPANPTRSAPIGFKFRLPNQNAVGPILAYGARALKLGAKKGISVHSLDARGGQSGYDFAYQAINAYTDQQLIDYCSVIRSYQIELGFKPIVVVALDTGHNDRNETLQPSLGYRGSTAGNSSAAYIDNVQAWIKRWRDIWKIAGWDDTELYIRIATSQRVPQTGALDPQLQSYAMISEPTLAGQERVSYVQLENLTTAEESRSLPNDTLHYTTAAGYDFLAVREYERTIPGFKVS